MSGLYFLLGLIVFFLIVTMLGYALEKRLVWPFVPAGDMPSERVPSANEYSHSAARMATAAGFTWLGTFGDGKGKLFRIRYDVFRSSEGDVLAVVGVGTVASILVQNTWLRTILSDGRSLVTIDNQMGGEVDLSGLIEEKLVAYRNFADLLIAHRARVQATGRSVEMFGATDAMSQLHEFRRGVVERLERMGNATFIDREHTAWRYSPKGALVLALRQYFNGLRRRVAPDAVPSSLGR